MREKVIILVVFLVAVVAIVLFAARRRPEPSAVGSTDAAAPSPSASSSAPPAGQTEISLLYSTEKKEWIEAATQEFGKQHPEIKVRLVGSGSLAGAQAIMDGKEKPTLFSPADTLVLAMAASDWSTSGKGELFAAQGDDAPASLVITPLVFVVWEDRADALLKSSKGAITWKTLEKALTSQQGWPAVGGKPEWGFVKLGHTDPTQSNSGLQALYSMTLEWYGKTAGIQVADLLKPDYQAFVKDIEKGVTKFESSTGTFMTDMIRFGPSKYDIAVVYENLAISQVERAQGRWGNLKVVYPQTTLWSDHPAVLLSGDWVTDPQKKAARLFLTFLRSGPVQEKALAFGFRPGEPAVPVKTADPQNPFNRLAPFGLRVDVPVAATPPDGSVVRNLETMWTRLVQR